MVAKYLRGSRYNICGDFYYLIWIDDAALLLYPNIFALYS